MVSKGEMCVFDSSCIMQPQSECERMINTYEMKGITIEPTGNSNLDRSDWEHSISINTYLFKMAIIFT